MKQRKLSVFMWRDGKLEFGVKCPDGALPIATGPEEDLREIVDVLAVKGGDGALRVRGVSVSGEARTAEEVDKTLKAVWDFQDEIEAGMGRYHKKRLEACHA